MRLSLPESPAETLRAALTEPSALRGWWDPDATVVGDELSPGPDGPSARVTVRGDHVVWDGAATRSTFDLAAGELLIEADLSEADRTELRLGWEIALTTLGWAIGRSDVRWQRFEVPVALSYGDAWGRIDGERGIGSGADRVRIAQDVIACRPLLLRPPRAVVLALAAPGLLRVALGPGDSVNAARVDILGADAPPAWKPWFEQRFGMTWTAQLRE